MLFNNYNYDCIYKASGRTGDSPEETHAVNVSLGHHACFGDMYRKIRDYKYADITYELYLFKDNLPDKHFNLCTHLETKKILRCLQKIVPFSYKFETRSYRKVPFRPDEVEYNVLIINIKGNFPQHVWTTSMLRCFFEFPYNVAAKEACELQSKVKKVGDFDYSKENWINLYLTVVSLLGSEGGHGVVSLYGNQPILRTYHEWKQKIENCGLSVINSLRQGGKEFKDSSQIRVRSQEEYDRGVESRALKYTAAYKDKLSWKN